MGMGIKSANDQVSINQVTPELAAQVVKYFVLPMFENDAKKGLRRKYGRMQASQVATASTMMTPSGPGGVEPDIPGMGTVMGDLKLTEHLSN